MTVCLFNLTLNCYNLNLNGLFTVQIERYIEKKDTQVKDSKTVGVMGLAAALYKITDLPSYLTVASHFSRSGTNRFSLTFPLAEDANGFVRKI